MAVNAKDVTNGFLHHEVVRFINEEVLINGGNSDFYQAFSVLSWNEIEDELVSILTDSHVPRTKQRVCAWSALALRVRVAARQEEQQAHRIQELKEQLKKSDAAVWVLVSQLQQLHQERQLLIAHLRCASKNRQLLQTNRQPAEAAPWPGDPQLATEGCSVSAEEWNELQELCVKLEKLHIPVCEEILTKSSSGSQQHSLQ